MRFADGADALEAHLHVASGLGGADRPLRTELGLLDAAHRDTVVHEGSDELRHQIRKSQPRKRGRIITVVLQNGLLSAAPYFALFLLGFVFSPISDLLIARKVLSMTALRKIMNSIGDTRRRAARTLLNPRALSRNHDPRCGPHSAGVRGEGPKRPRHRAPDHRGRCERRRVLRLQREPHRPLAQPLRLPDGHHERDFEHRRDFGALGRAVHRHG